MGDQKADKVKKAEAMFARYPGLTEVYGVSRDEVSSVEPAKEPSVAAGHTGAVVGSAWLASHGAKGLTARERQASYYVPGIVGTEQLLPTDEPGGGPPRPTAANRLLRHGPLIGEGQYVTPGAVAEYAALSDSELRAIPLRVSLDEADRGRRTAALMVSKARSYLRGAKTQEELSRRAWEITPGAPTTWGNQASAGSKIVDMQTIGATGQDIDAFGKMVVGSTYLAKQASAKNGPDSTSAPSAAELASRVTVGLNRSDIEALSDAVSRRISVEPTRRAKQGELDRLAGIGKAIAEQRSAGAAKPSPVVIGDLSDSARQEAEKLARNERGSVSALDYYENAIARGSGAFGPFYGLRPDGTPKGRGWLGEIPTSDGGIATEYTTQSEAVKVNGNRIDFPTLVPTLSPAELRSLATDIIPNRKPIPEPIMRKAIDHANAQLGAGKSVFAPGKGSAKPPSTFLF